MFIPGNTSDDTKEEEGSADDKDVAGDDKDAQQAQDKEEDSGTEVGSAKGAGGVDEGLLH